MTVGRIGKTHSSGCYSIFFWLLPYVGKGIKRVERPKKADKIGANKSLQQLARVKRGSHIIYHEKHGFF